MIELLQPLIKKNGVASITFTVSALPNDQVSVVIQPVLGEEPKDCDDDMRKIRTALSSPIVTTGYVGEVDAHLTKTLEQYINNGSHVAGKLSSNISETTDNLTNTDAEEDNNTSDSINTDPDSL